jgi:hypothetical protein
MYCNLHDRTDCTLCDECGHESAQHLNGHDAEHADRAFIFDNATCWAENICSSCDPFMHALAVELSAMVPA